MEKGASGITGSVVDKHVSKIGMKRQTNTLIRLNTHATVPTYLHILITTTPMIPQQWLVGVIKSLNILIASFLP